MANFELFLMIYVLVFYYEIRRMPSKAGLWRNKRAKMRIVASV